jgi:hypothetical protein
MVAGIGALMSKEVVWCGFPMGTCTYPENHFVGTDSMTAIAVIFDHIKDQFTIAADGRCASLPGPLLNIKTDSQQKIFPFQRGPLNLAFCISGLAQIDSFESMKELSAQVETLSLKHFNSGYEFASKVSSGIKRVFEKALKDGRLETIPTSEELQSQESGRFLKIMMLGYYGRNPFLVIRAFYFHGKGFPVEIRTLDAELSQPQSLVRCFGSQPISDMLFGNAPIDPRMEHYKRTMSGADTLAATTTYIRACSDQAAIAIDPYCRMIGGYIHAAQISKNEFRWLIQPTPTSPPTH